MKVVAKVTHASVQGRSIAKGTVGEVKFMHKTVQLMKCPHSGGTNSVIVSVLWSGGYRAIHSDLTNIIIQCSKI